MKELRYPPKINKGHFQYEMPIPINHTHEKALAHESFFQPFLYRLEDRLTTRFLHFFYIVRNILFVYSKKLQSILAVDYFQTSV